MIEVREEKLNDLILRSSKARAGFPDNRRIRLIQVGEVIFFGAFFFISDQRTQRGLNVQQRLRHGQQDFFIRFCP